MASVYSVAKHIRDRIPGVNAFKLQKLLYYVQAWSIAWNGQRMFADELQAWKDGPVVAGVFEDVKHHASRKIKQALPVEPSHAGLIDRVLGMYGHYDHTYLIDLSHNEAPWKAARGDLGPLDKSQTPISEELIASFYQKLWVDAQESNEALNSQPIFQGSIDDFCKQFEL
jgi:uncharacterized phage-associated protein